MIWPILPDIVSYGFSLSEDGTLWGELDRAVRKDILPYIDPHAYGVRDVATGEMRLTRDVIGKLPKGMESSDVGFLFVILTNIAPVEVFNLSFNYRLYVNSFPMTKEDVTHWKTKADPDRAGLPDGSLVHMAGQKEVLRLASKKKKIERYCN